MHPRIAAGVKLIAEDRAHGAGWLAREAVEALADAVEDGADPLESAQALASARPAMGAIAGAVGRVLALGRSQELLLEQARELIDARDRAAHSIAVLLRPELEGTVMTHSAPATVRAAFLLAQPARVVCTISEPEAEGRGFADDLTAQGLTVELVADADAEHAVTSVNRLVLGADTVFRDGSLANKTGTSGIAKAANDAGVPVIVAFETFKLAPFDPSDPEEESRDLTPAERIDSYVTEEGTFGPEDIPALMDRTPFLREGWALLRPTAPSSSST